MPHTDADLKNWHNWTDPDFFTPDWQRESRLIPLLLRQVLPARVLRTQLTLTGWCLIIVSLGIGAAAYTTASNILFLALSLLLSSLILSGVLSWINFRQLKWDLIAPKNLTVNEVGVAEVELANNKSIFPSMSICFQLESETISSNESIYMQQTLHAGKSCKLEWTFVPLRRGRFNLTLSGVQSKFPFGFLKKVAGSDLQSTILVWPARIEYTFKVSSGSRHTFIGTPQKQSGHGNDLLNIVRYEHGDSPRLIHWKATARTRQLMVRKFSDERESGYHIQVDTDPSQWTPELFERLCSLVRSLAEDLFYLGKLESATIGDSGSMQIRNLYDLHMLFNQLSLLKRQLTPVKAFLSGRSNQITFRPQGASGIAIYVKQNYSGQSNS